METRNTSGARSALRAVFMAGKGRKTLFILCMLCAMAFSAIVAQGASAAGQTAFTCVATAPVLEFETEHCVPGQNKEKNFGHVAIPVNEVTHLKLSNDKTNATTTGPTNAVFKETIAATNLELEATGTVEGLGTMKNELVGAEMRASAESGTNGISYNGVIVKAPAGKGCKVFEDKEATKEKGAEGVVTLKPVKGHTTVVKETVGGVETEVHSIILEPKEAGSNLLATFFIECEKGKGVPAELEGTWEIKGTFTCPTHGATIECSHTTITGNKSLIGKGAKAGLEGKATATAGKEPITEPTHPISVTTE